MQRELPVNRALLRRPGVPQDLAASQDVLRGCECERAAAYGDDPAEGDPGGPCGLLRSRRQDGGALDQPGPTATPQAPLGGCETSRRGRIVSVAAGGGRRPGTADGAGGTGRRLCQPCERPAED